MKRMILGIAAVATLVAPLAGCTSLTGFSTKKLTGWLKKNQRSEFVVADRSHPVERIICVWQPGEGRGLDNLPCRGFAGQIFFFTHSLLTPVVGNGMVQVFLFDDQGPPEEQVKPLHVFEFTREAWNRLLVKTQFGPAYNVFIPYVRKGMHEAECALLVRLVPEDGGLPVLSDMAYIRLPGVKTKRNDQPEQASETPKDHDLGTSKSTTPTTRTETIRPSFRLARELAKAVKQNTVAGLQARFDNTNGRPSMPAAVWANSPQSLGPLKPASSVPAREDEVGQTSSSARSSAPAQKNR